MICVKENCHKIIITNTTNQGFCFKHSIESRFWKCVDINGPIIKNELGPCWLWTSPLSGRGKPQIFVNKLGYVAAQCISYELHIGPIPIGLFGCHKCDNPICVNYQHIFPGSNQDNLKDMSNKGRHIGNRKLNWDIVRNIRTLHKLGFSGEVLARKLQISTVPRIIQNKLWKT